MAFGVTVYKFLGEDSYNGIKTTVDIDKLIEDGYKNQSITYKKSYDNVSVVHISGPNAININQYGRIPFGAWNPVENNLVDITNSKDFIELNEMYKGTKPNYHIDEKGTKIITENPFKNNPVLDLIGKPILIWSSDSNMTVSIDDDIVLSSSRQKNGKFKEFIAIIFNPSFSMRIAAFGLSKEQMTNDDRFYFYKSILFEKKDCLQSMIINSNEKNEDILHKANKFIKDEGLITTISNVKINDVKFDQMTFSYPMLPEKLGVSLWGAVPELLIENAQGAIMIDSESKSIGAQSSLRINGIKNLSAKHGFLSLSAHGTNEFKADFDSIYINGDIAYSNWDRLNKVVGIVTSIMCVFAFLFAIFSHYHKK